MRRVAAPAVLSADDGGQNMKAGTHGALSGRVDPGRGGLFVSERVRLTALPVASTIGRAHPQEVSPKDGVATPTVIFALCLEESKGENDVPQLPDRKPKIWKDPQGPATLSLLPVLQDILRPPQ